MSVASATRPATDLACSHAIAASECMVVLLSAKGARRELMQHVFVKLAVVVACLSAAGAPLNADNRTAPKGPDEDGPDPDRRRRNDEFARLRLPDRAERRHWRPCHRNSRRAQS